VYRPPPSCRYPFKREWSKSWRPCLWIFFPWKALFLLDLPPSCHLDQVILRDALDLMDHPSRSLRSVQIFFFSSSTIVRGEVPIIFLVSRAPSLLSLGHSAGQARLIASPLLLALCLTLNQTSAHLTAVLCLSGSLHSWPIFFFLFMVDSYSIFFF